MESGYLPLTYEREVFAIRKGVHLTLFIGLFLFIVQTALLCFGVPVGLWESCVAGLAQWLESIAPGSHTRLSGPGEAMIRTFILLTALLGASWPWPRTKRTVSRPNSISRVCPATGQGGRPRTQDERRRTARRGGPSRFAAPSLSKRERRHQRWERVFGPGTFRVSRTRYRDGMLLASESIDLKGNKPLCVMLPQFDRRPLAVRSYHEEGIDPTSPSSSSVQTSASSSSSAPWQHLIYEAIDTRPGEGLQVIRVERATTILEITETSEHEEVCLKRNDLNLEKKKKKKKKKPTPTSETPPSS